MKSDEELVDDIVRRGGEVFQRYGVTSLSDKRLTAADRRAIEAQLYGGGDANATRGRLQIIY